MAMPPRHTSASIIIGIGGTLIADVFIAYRTVLLLLTYFTVICFHGVVDWAFNEYWQRTKAQTIAYGVILGIPWLLLLYFAYTLGGMPFILLVIAGLLPDIVDDIICPMLSKIFKRQIGPYFPTHFGSPWYIKPLYEPSETFMQTMYGELIALGILLLTLVIYKCL